MNCKIEMDSNLKEFLFYCVKSGLIINFSETKENYTVTRYKNNVVYSWETGDFMGERLRCEQTAHAPIRSRGRV